MISAIDVYDHIYSWKNYRKESKQLELYLLDLGVINGTLLELACGTGRYISFLKNWNCTGVDLCPRSIEIARLVNPGSTFFVANMNQTGVVDRFDVVICLFGGISYLRSDEVDDAIDHWRSLLNPGGILIIEPWLEEGQIHFGTPFLHTHKTEELFTSRTVVPKLQNNACVLDFSFLILANGDPVRRFIQRDVLHLHRKIWLLNRFEANGFSLNHEREGFLKDSILWFFQKLK